MICRNAAALGIEAHQGGPVVGNTRHRPGPSALHGGWRRVKGELALLVDKRIEFAGFQR
jgi:hypothetical protein